MGIVTEDIVIGGRYRTGGPLASPDTGQIMIDSDLLHHLRWAEDSMAADPELVILTSGYRTPEYNKDIGGKENSLHTQGRAIDFTLKDTSLLMTFAVLLRNDALVVLLNPEKKFIHVEIPSPGKRPGLRVWMYSRSLGRKDYFNIEDMRLLDIMRIDG